MLEMIQKNKGKLIFSSLLIMLPIFAGLLLWRKVPLLPLFFLATHWFCLLLIFNDKQNRKQSKKAIGLVFWICPTISLFSYAMIYMTLTKADAVSFLMILMCFCLGLIFTLFGNYFPKFRQNNTLGIRIKWTLQNEENWNATHRFGGKTWVTGGLLLMVSGLLGAFRDFTAIFSICFFLIITFISILPCIYSYMYYKKQVKEGRVNKNERASLKSVVLVSGLVIAFSAFLFYVLFTGDMNIAYGESSFTIESKSWENLTINYADINDIEYQAFDIFQSASDTRTCGFGNFQMSLGFFQNEIYGDYIRYSFVQCDSCIVLNVNGSSFANEQIKKKALKNLISSMLSASPRRLERPTYRLGETTTKSTSV